jgi:hypothetical protein
MPLLLLHANAFRNENARSRMSQCHDAGQIRPYCNNSLKMDPARVHSQKNKKARTANLCVTTQPIRRGSLRVQSRQSAALEAATGAETLEST